MDKNGARGRAEKTVSIFLEGCLKDGVIDIVLSKHYEDKNTVAAIKREIQGIADEHARLAELHKAIEQGTSDRQVIAHNYMNAPLTLAISEEHEGSYSVTWDGLCGYSMVTFYCSTAVDADKLFHALQTVIGTEEN